MKETRSDDELDALLAEGRFAGPTRDRVFEAVVNNRAVSPPRRGRAWGLSLAGLSLALGAAAIALVPRVRRDGDELRAKGGLMAGVPLVDVTCAGGSFAACPVGSTLVFTSAGGHEAAYLAAYAEPRGGGERIWYFSGAAVPLPVAAETAAVPRAVRVGPEHAPGVYRLTMLVSRAPLAKEALLRRGGAAPLLSERVLDLTIVAVPQ